jgi:hypothetical protein
MSKIQREYDERSSGRSAVPRASHGASSGLIATRPLPDFTECGYRVWLFKRGVRGSGLAVNGELSRGAEFRAQCRWGTFRGRGMTLNHNGSNPAKAPVFIGNAVPSRSGASICWEGPIIGEILAVWHRCGPIFIKAVQPLRGARIWDLQ